MGVPSLEELNRICQKPRYREVGNWMVRTFLRDAALPITWVLLHTKVTANQVTLFSLGVGLASTVFLSLPSTLSFVTGALLLELWYLLDHVDGQIARYRETASLSGRFFDFMTHHLIHTCLFFALGVHAFWIRERLFFIFWGFLASLSVMMFNLIYDTKYKTFFEKLSSMNEIVTVRPQAELSSPHVFSGDPRFSATKTADPSSGGRGDDRRRAPDETSLLEKIFRKSFSLFHKLCEIHVVMNILLATAIIQAVMKLSFDLRTVLFIFYGLTVPTLAVVKATYLIVRKEIDREFDRQFQLH